eukprot:7381188-Prymnesium_polylepis.1
MSPSPFGARGAHLQWSTDGPSDTQLHRRYAFHATLPAFRGVCGAFSERMTRTSLSFDDGPLMCGSLVPL